MSEMTPEQFDTYVSEYRGRRLPEGRFASFDYCFNYVQGAQAAGPSAFQTIGRGPQLQTSCLQLGAYLASWGMYRGKATLLQRSVKSLVPAIEAIVSAPDLIWSIDVDTYNEGSDAILAVGSDLRAALPGDSSDTLVTKVMLGVFGCVPAFDRYVRKGLGVHALNTRALRRVADFYSAHRPDVDRHVIQTIDFVTGMDTTRVYTKAKVIDMAFFIAGAA